MAEEKQFDEYTAKAKVFLYAAIPLIEEVIPAKEKLQQMIRAWNCAVQIEVLNTDIATHLVFSGGAVKVEKGRHPKPILALCFKDAKHLADTFAGKKAPMPKVKGMWHIILLMKTQKLLNQLQMLQPDYDVTDPALRELKVKMLLYMISGAIQILSEEGEEFIRNVTLGSRGKYIEWKVLPDGPHCHAKIDQGHVEAGRGKPPKRPFAGMEFRDIDAAYDLLTSKVSAQDAVIQGLSVITGSAEYGVRIAQLMMHTGNFLQPPEEKQEKKPS